MSSILSSLKYKLFPKVRFLLALLFMCLFSDKLTFLNYKVII